MKFKYAQGLTLVALQKSVVEMVNEGWEPVGGPAIMRMQSGGDVCCQGMTFDGVKVAEKLASSSSDPVVEVEKADSVSAKPDLKGKK